MLSNSLNALVTVAEMINKLTHFNTTRLGMGDYNATAATSVPWRFSIVQRTLYTIVFIHLNNRI